MGLVINGSLVTVDHAVKEHLITEPDGNPKVSTLPCGLEVTSLFTRMKASGKQRRDRSVRVIGDNCPLLYALKNKDNLHTDIESIKKICTSGYSILDGLRATISANSVVYMPSAYTLSFILAKRISNVLGATLFDNVYLKTPKIDALVMLDRAYQIGNIDRNAYKSLQFSLSKNPIFSLKDVPVHYRGIFDPVKLNPNFQGPIHGDVILVDDLLATGRTLSVARSLISSPQVRSVQAVCLFSDV